MTDHYKSVGRAKKIIPIERGREKKKQRKLKNTLRKVDPRLKSEVHLVKQILSICCSLLPEYSAESNFLNDSIHLSYLRNAHASGYPFGKEGYTVSCETLRT